ncbi:uncharacterized protein ANIA_10037 [Aspergillus nidulans FGSC A4]|uniref:Uncharacterized protein n=1 Tax=Emericella nidulans (strain FGSC A4 / ATCC 38163 / CBS 112.46 / NRRL 194 / M139) TaxID=227321 RepID=C8VQ58_EMENI|nr:hypothetical protein [Aspergillus nidulans FGSC A4]CBF90083.1 TPA: conserved hypothetical protein [Aspergillus nidulans FGSC A4]
MRWLGGSWGSSRRRGRGSHTSTRRTGDRAYFRGSDQWVNWMGVLFGFGWGFLTLLAVCNIVCPVREP